MIVGANYLSDRCLIEKESLWFRVYYWDEAPGFCKDGTVSYEQPKSTGLGGWEGKCGQTAAANIVYGMCNVPSDPRNQSGTYMRDFTPGVAPSDA